MYTEKTASNIQTLLILMYLFMLVSTPAACSTLSDFILTQLQSTTKVRRSEGWSEVKTGALYRLST